MLWWLSSVSPWRWWCILLGTPTLRPFLCPMRNLPWICGCIGLSGVLSRSVCATCMVTYIFTRRVSDSDAREWNRIERHCSAFSWPCWTTNPAVSLVGPPQYDQSSVTSMPSLNRQAAVFSFHASSSPLNHAEKARTSHKCLWIWVGIHHRL